MTGLNVVHARNTEAAPKGFANASQTVAFSHYNNFSAQLPIDPSTGNLVEGDIKEQAQQCFNNIEAIVSSIDRTLNDIIRLTIFVTDIKHQDSVNHIFTSFFNTYLPARTFVVVDELPMGAQVQVDALLSHGLGTIPEQAQADDLIKLVNNTPNAPVCSFSSQTVAFSHYNNITAQLPLDPKTGRLVVGGVKEETAQCLRNIKAILESIDVPLDDIVRITIFLTDLADLEAVNEVYTTFFPDSGIARAVNYLPARTVAAVKALEYGAKVQIEAVVSHGDGTPPQAIEDRHGLIIEAYNTDQAPIDPYSTQTVAFSHYNHISAQLPIDAQSGELIDGDITAQTEQCFNHIKAIVESIDHVMADVVKVNVILKDLNNISAVEEVFTKFFPENAPGLRFVGSQQILKDADIQIDAVVGNTEGTPPIK